MSNPYARYGYATGQPSGPFQGNSLIDCPRPSAGVICSFLAFPFVILGIMFGSTYLLTGGSVRVIQSVSMTYMIVFGIVLAVFGFLLLMICRIKYTLDGQALRLFTIVKSYTVPLNHIVYGEKSRWNRRLMGWGPMNAGLCNRWSNGLCLTVSGGRRYFLYLTPSDPDAFLAHLTAFKEQVGR